MATGEVVSIVIHSTDANTGKKISTSVSNINPEATNAELLNLATMLNSSLTTNRYEQTNKITNYIVDVQQGE